MMNLSSYDLVDSFTSNKPYIDKTRNKLYLVGIYNYKYFLWLKRFNKESSMYDYFILLTNTYTDDIHLTRCNYNNNHELRVFIPNDIINELNNNKADCFNVNLNLDDKQEDCIVYKVEV